MNPRTHMEERPFLHKLCDIALQVDTSIEFAGIVDSNGKLLVGRARKIPPYDYLYTKKKNNSASKSANFYGRAVFKDKAITASSIKSIVSLQSALVDDQALFRLINLNDDVFLAYIPINELNEKFLYIYFRTGEYLEDVLLRLDSTFF